MSIDTVTTFFALLAVVALAGVIASVSLWAVAATRSRPRWVVAAHEAVQPVALWLATAVAATATLGSLYLSEIAGFPPCELCWYQRIAMYPLTVVLAVAALRRDAAVRYTAVPIAGIGLAISIYHYLVERFPDSIDAACSTETPCSVVWVWKFHFLSIPAMAGAGFGAIIALVLLARPADPERSTDPLDPTPTPQEQHQ